jgi:hypothetical protein
MRSSGAKIHGVNLYPIQDSGWPREVDEVFNTMAQNLVAFNALEVIPQLGAINICNLVKESI